MKKAILLSLISASIILNSSLSVSMNKKYATSSINLGLCRKKTHIFNNGYISTYEWCKKKAAEFLEEKKSALLQGLGISIEEFQEIKETFIEKIEKIEKIENSPTESDHEDLEENPELATLGQTQNNTNNTEPAVLGQTHDGPINKAIKETLKNAVLTKALKIKKILVINNIVHAERENGCPIKFFKTSKNYNHLSFQDGHNIFISTKVYLGAKNWWLKTCSLEAHIGHELAHILCKHFIEKCLFEALYELQIKQNQLQTKPDPVKQNQLQTKPDPVKQDQLQTKQNPLEVKQDQPIIKQNAKPATPKFELDLLLNKFIIATEIQADIVGIFNNTQWAKDQFNCYSTLTEETESSNYENYANNKHPSFKERANYFKEILGYMQKESRQEVLKWGL